MSVIWCWGVPLLGKNLSDCSSLIGPILVTFPQPGVPIHHPLSVCQPIRAEAGPHAHCTSELMFSSLIFYILLCLYLCIYVFLGGRILNLGDSLSILLTDLTLQYALLLPA